ncbi:MAG: bifunctional demethylmenaquinone methyltransferase/2-methoxy-6-polyprenyl-1,4-benzoquinol methylase UbiE [Bacteroidales bacterium]
MANTLKKDRASISAMFNSIAHSYDLLNHLLSFGIDKYWRGILVKKLMKRRPATVLDIACGTGDLTIALCKKGVKVTGLDIADAMIEIAKKKSDRCFEQVSGIAARPSYISGSADSIPLADKSFDAVTIGFGIRNFENRGESLLEINRVLKSGGSLAILEFATPRNKIWKFIFNLYFLKVLPAIGTLISGDKNAYSYLPQSVESFPQYNEFATELEHFGFENVEYKSLTGGIAILYFAVKKD